MVTIAQESPVFIVSQIHLLYSILGAARPIASTGIVSAKNMPGKRRIPGGGDRGIPPLCPGEWTNGRQNSKPALSSALLGKVSLSEAQMRVVPSKRKKSVAISSFLLPP